MTVAPCPRCERILLECTRCVEKITGRRGPFDPAGAPGRTFWEVGPRGTHPLPLFAAADDRAGLLRPEALEPSVTLAPMSGARSLKTTAVRA